MLVPLVVWQLHAELSLIVQVTELIDVADESGVTGGLKEPETLMLQVLLVVLNQLVGHWLPVESVDQLSGLMQ